MEESEKNIESRPQMPFEGQKIERKSRANLTIAKLRSGGNKRTEREKQIEERPKRKPYQHGAPTRKTFQG